MKIINVTPGLLPIPPNGWGAVEKIIWETHLSLIDLGYDSEILYLNQVPKNADIVHIHVANLANEAHKRGIPYYFTMHDHHAYLYGKNSAVYKENLEAIQNAKKAFVPAKYLVDWFNGIPEYFSHGVNTEYFKDESVKTKHKLLCVANNGFLHDQSEDRKGFVFAIEVAKKIALPITIVGPENNKKYFEKNPSDYSELNIIYSASEDELLKIYKEHSVFIHASVLEAGHPNLTLLEAMSCGLPVLATFENNNELEGLIKIERNVDSIMKGLMKVFSDYHNYSDKARNQALKLSWKNRTKELLKFYDIEKAYIHTIKNSNQIEKIKINMKDKLMLHYNNTKINLKHSKKYKPSIRINNIDGAFIEILGESKDEYTISFINNKTANIEFQNKMKANHWSRTNIKYFVDWIIKVEDGTNWYDYRTNFENKTVYIALDSKSLGDTLAWFPYVDEFRKKHKCKIICSTFWNHFFEKEYPHIEFITPGQTANGIEAMYTIGLFYDKDGKVDYNKHPQNPISGPLQKVASDILGLDYVEIKPKIKKVNPIKRQKKYVTIGFHSTCQTKYWNNPSGWKEVSEYIKSNGLEPVFMSKEGTDYMGNKYPDGVASVIPKDIDEAMELIEGSEFFIGISSGLSWLAWALGKKVVLISGFTKENLEFTDCIRIINNNVCNGCWHRHKFDPGDWNWCPDHKGTYREFECTKTITGKDVIEKLKKLIV